VENHIIVNGDIMSEKLIATIIIGVAGLGVTGWTVFIFLLMWT